MSEQRWLYFALGVATVLSLGAGAHQLVRASPPGLVLSDTGITFPDGTVQTTAAGQGWKSNARSYYLTTGEHDGASALTACGDGYHMASFFELADLGNLRYAIERPDAASRADSGIGPPSWRIRQDPGPDDWWGWGWVRTGMDSWTDPDPGKANCDVWTSGSADDQGTWVGLKSDWGQLRTSDGNGIDEPYGRWVVQSDACSTDRFVWCIED